MTFNKVASNFFFKNNRFPKNDGFDVFSLMIVNDNPWLTIVNVKNDSLKVIVKKKQSYKNRSQIVFIKTIVLKNDRYSLSKSLKRVIRF